MFRKPKKLNCTGMLTPSGNKAVRDQKCSYATMNEIKGENIETKAKSL